MSYNEIYGRYRRDLHGFRRSTRKTGKEDDGPIGTAIIIIEFPFDSRLPIPNRRKKRTPNHVYLR